MMRLAAKPGNHEVLAAPEPPLAHPNQRHSLGKLPLAITPWAWQNTPAFRLPAPIFVGGSPGASRGPGICPTRPTNMAVAIVSIASARCAVRAAGSTPWVAYAPRAAQWEEHTKPAASARSATTAWRNIPEHAAVRSAEKPASRFCFRGPRFTNLYASITNIYARCGAIVLSYGGGDTGHSEPCWRTRAESRLD